VCPYVCADGRGLYLAMVQEAVEWQRFTAAIGRPDLCSDPRFVDVPARRANAPALVAILDALFASQPLAHWRAELDRRTVTFGVIAQVDELPNDPQLVANGVFRPVVGEGVRAGLRTVDSPIHLDGVAKRPAQRAPDLGEHGREILASLGYPAERIDALVREGVVREPVRNEQMTDATLRSLELLRRWTLILGVLQILVGCLVGLIPPTAVEWFRGIVMAHIEFTANGVLMIAIGLLTRELSLSQSALYVWFATLQFGTWTNGAAGVAAAFGGASSSFMPTLNEKFPPPHGSESALVTGLLLVCAVTIIVALVLTLYGLVRGGRRQ